MIDKQPRDETSGVVTVEQRVKNQRGEDVMVGTPKILVARGGEAAGKPV